jgi:hypothetical protein
LNVGRSDVVEVAAVVARGGVQQMKLATKPGTWVLACFMDAQDGREHTGLGMEQVIPNRSLIDVNTTPRPKRCGLGTRVPRPDLRADVAIRSPAAPAVILQTQLSS